MTEVKLTDFNVLGCLNRIDKILDSNPQGKMEKRKSIPSEAEMTYENGYYIDCVALSVDIRGSSKLPEKHTKPVLAKIYRSYLSSIISLMNSCVLNSHTRIVGDAVLGIFRAPNPAKHVKEVYEVGLRIQNVINMLNDKLEKKNYKTIKVGIGISYGEALAVKAGFLGSGINDIIWMGDVVNTASKIGNEGNKNGNHAYMICPSVYNFISTTGDAGLFSWNDAKKCYHGSVYHLKTQEVYDRIKKTNTSSSKTTTVLGSPPAFIPRRPSLFPVENPFLPSIPTVSSALGLLNTINSVPQRSRLSELAEALYKKS